MKQKQKEEMAGIEEFVSNIRNLQQEKEAIIQQLEAENTDLRRQADQVTMERDAFIQDSQKISELLRSAGLQKYMKKSPGQQVEHLIQEIDKAQRERSSLNDAKAELERELKSAKEQLDSKQRDLEETMYHARKKTNSLEKTLEEVRDSHEAEMSKIQAERDQLESDVKTLQEREAKLETEVSDFKKKGAIENSSKEVAIKGLRDEIDGNCLYMYKVDIDLISITMFNKLRY